MKKIMLCLLCVGLVACDRNSLTGVCYVDKEKTVSVIQKSKGAVDTKEQFTTTFVCACFDDISNEEPLFVLPVANKEIKKPSCYKKCTKMCNEEVKKRDKTENI